MPAPLATSAAAIDVASTRWGRLEGWLGRLGERLNPILVKEARQALRSRQFLGTFFLLLIAGWAYSLWWIADQGPQVAFAARGWELFIAYYSGLSLALLVFVPYIAYTSLAGERQDRTFELVAITNLTPRQIVFGKLTSAGLQMLIFLSAAAPFMALAYLLRGIDLPTMLMIVGFLILFSFTATAIALFVATLTRERHWQTLLGVALVVGLFIGFGSLLPAAHEILRFDPFDAADPWVWIGALATLTGVIGTFALVVQASAAQLTFEADNRSTGLRIIMLVHQAVFLGWMAWVFYAVERGHPEIIAIYASFSGLYWWIMGTLMTAESTTLSPRVRRGLPRSIWTRAAFALLMPGSATGYLLVIVGLSAVMIATAVGQVLGPLWRPTGRMFGIRDEQVLWFVLLGASYVLCYVGLGKKILDSIRHVANFNLILPLILQVVLLAVGCGVPSLLALYMSSGYSSPEYSLLQVTNVAWTLAETMQPQFPANASAAAVMIMVPVAAIAIFLWNLPSLLRELSQGHLPTPERIAAEEEALERQRQASQQHSPWDEGPPTHP